MKEPFIFFSFRRFPGSRFKISDFFVTNTFTTSTYTNGYLVYTVDFFMQPRQKYRKHIQCINIPLKF